MDPASLTASLLDVAAYPHAPARVELRTTHASLLFFAGERVYKVKKPVDLGFLDFTTLERRRHFCEEEVRLNARLAPWVYRGVVPIARTCGGALRVGAEGEVVEWAVEMLCLPEERMLDRLLEGGAIDNEMLGELAARLVRFHREAARGPEIDRFGSPESVARIVDGNLGELRRLAASASPGTGGVSGALLAFLEERTRAFLSTRRALLERRVREGRIREGHGDLHAGNICFAPQGLAIYDCIEFSRELRCLDVACDLAFLSMDLDRRGFPSFGDWTLRRYALEAADPELLELAAFYKGYRALVRAKVALLGAREETREAPQRRELEREAREYVALATGYALAPALVLLCGLPGSGKTWLARELVRPLRAALLHSDVRRRRLADPAALAAQERYGEGRYSLENRTRTYDALLEEALSVLERGKSVIVDASFSRASWRALFLAGAARHGYPVYLIHVTAADDLVRERLAARTHDAREASEADPCVFEAERARFEAPDEVPPPGRLEFASGVLAPEAFVAAFLERRVAREPPSGAGTGPDPPDVPGTLRTRA